MSDIVDNPIAWAVEERDKYWNKKIKKLELKIKCMYTIIEMRDNFREGYEQGHEDAEEELKKGDEE